MSGVGFAGALGFPPKLSINDLGAPETRKPVNSEKAKYEKMWKREEYRMTAPGEEIATTFMSIVKPAKGERVIDFGSGTGRGALMLALFGLKVTMVDIAENSLDEDIKNCLTTQSHMMDFKLADLREPLGIYAKYGFCTDVMEHIPTRDVQKVLAHILQSAQYVFFQISLREDHFGETVNEELHLTVKPYEWWYAQLKELDAVINWSAHDDNGALFYVTAWQNGSELIKHGKVNTEHEEILAQIKSNIERGLVELTPHEKTDRTVVILAGGPSMNEFTDEIKQKRAEGCALVTVNNTYNWALDNGMDPSAFVMVDAREFNKRFVERIIPSCRYMLASQCHPAVFDAIPKEQTILWHSAVSDDIVAFLEKHYAEKNVAWYPVMGGSSVMLRVLPLMVMLGYSNFEIYGWDSCVRPNGEHHAYPQPENDNVVEVQVIVNGRTFTCHPAHASQAQEFLDLMTLMAEHINLNVHGDGLISHIIQTAADLNDIETVESNLM